MKQSNTPQVASARPRRSPLERKNRISIKNQDPNYKYRIVNDLDDNIAELQERGYELVPASEVGRVGDKRIDNISALGSDAYLSVGQGTKATVMRIRKDWYEEDQAIKQKQIDDVENTIYRPENLDSGKIKVTHNFKETA